MDLVKELIKEGWLKTPHIIEAFEAIKRQDFLPAGIKNLAELNEAIPIGFGQTISQPLVVAFMIEQLQPEPGDKILDIGSGSGWTTALLAYIVSQEGSELPDFKRQGKVIALELVPELKEFGESNVAKYNFIEKGIAEFFCQDASKGYPSKTPFDKILASASASFIPVPWKEELVFGGRIVAPVGSSILVLEKKKDGSFEEKEYPGFSFVPLLEK